MADLDQPLRAPGLRALRKERAARIAAESRAQRMAAHIKDLEDRIAELEARPARA